jgi:hypothetical protein
MDDLDHPESSDQWPALSPAIRESIAEEQYEIHKRYTGQLEELCRLELPPGDFLERFTRIPPVPRPKQPIRLCGILRDYARDLFDAEAKHYPKEPQLSAWGTNLVDSVGLMVAQRISEIAKSPLINLAYHATGEQASTAISGALEDRLKELLAEPEILSTGTETVSSESVLGRDNEPTLMNPEPPVSESLPEQLNRLRRECRWTVDTLAEKVNLDVRTVQRHLAGSRKPRLAHIGAYERVFSKALDRVVLISEMPV